MKMLTFVSENTVTHPKIFASGVLQKVYYTTNPDAVPIFQRCATVVLHLGLNPMNYEAILDEKMAAVIRGLDSKADYFVQMDVLTVLKILLTNNNEKLRAAAAKVYLDTVTATTVSSKFTNVLAICGFILQYY